MFICYINNVPPPVKLTLVSGKRLSSKLSNGKLHFILVLHINEVSIYRYMYRAYRRRSR